ncbi:protein of unknown function [Acetoanaerobium sticklandii]|uniref:Uncharacterized protein n=1 Tax=Acetoanaerobium sticklandii (strain ATCC 12662 / DSM 519 / JCM 1433 / CCUG 9281 / NCIMB 10654 / HF) TaxID=499177 RepID=E3PVT0_ACESD|nr:hypothetical protein [Acetoanaerobium sticklandii]CBH22633.1 protein of unknown function [Acetoanaerobium sticklandii]
MVELFEDKNKECDILFDLLVDLVDRQIKDEYMAEEVDDYGD